MDEHLQPGAADAEKGVRRGEQQDRRQQREARGEHPRIGPFQLGRSVQAPRESVMNGPIDTARGQREEKKAASRGPCT